MSQCYQAVQVSERVYWVGAIDWGIRDFHGYATSRGTTYNAYLILGSEPILVDTVKAPFYDEMMTRIQSVLPPGEIRHIISNHAEMDHAGGLPRAIADIQPDSILASKQGVRALSEHFHWEQPVRAIADGERVVLGDAALRFVETRMIHWPDSMFSFLEGDGVLFSNDAFGMHLASSERFVDELPLSLCQHEAAKYYANILMPFSPRVEKILAKLPGLGLDIRVLATDHGPVWRSDLNVPLDLYQRWAEQKPTNRAVVVYDTMWGSTEMMAQAVGDGLIEAGVSLKIMPLAGSHRSDVATEVLRAGALIVGSPTLNSQLFPSVADILCYLKGLRPRNLVGAAYGSYGWSGQSVALVEEELKSMKVTLAAEGYRSKYVPEADDLQACRKLGLSVAAALKERLAG